MSGCETLSSLYLPIVTGFIGGALTLSGVWLSNKNSRRLLALQLDRVDKKAHDEALRDRLEELYEVVGKWANSYVAYHTLYRTVMEGGMSYNDALDIQNSRGSDGSASRMFTLGELYFEGCRKQLDEIKRLRDLYSDIQTDFKEHYKESGQPSKKHSKAITDILILSVEAIDGYKKELGKYVREV